MTMPLAILGCGAVTPVGLSALQTCTAIQARISGIRTILALPPDFEPILGAQVPAKQELRNPLEQWLCQLASRAMREALESVPRSTRPVRIAALLCVPEPERWKLMTSRAGAWSWLGELQPQLPMPMHRASCVFQSGHAAYVEALETATQLLAADTVDACLVTGVDSMLSRCDLDRLSSWRRLRTSEVPQGVLPGEGAACLLVARRGPHMFQDAATIVGFGLGHETDTVLGTRTSIGTGLIAAVRGAVTAAKVSEAAISLRVSDVNAERYRGLESMLAEARFYRQRRSRLQVLFPAQAVGDLGAASGPLLAIVAAHRLSEGGLAICESSSEQGKRGACLIAHGELPMTAPPGRAIIAAISEQHATDAVFLWQQRIGLARGQHDVSLTALGDHDLRIAAHLAGLHAAGEGGWQRVSPLLVGQEPGEVFVAAACAITAGSLQRMAAVYELAESSPELCRGLIAACGWLAYDDVAALVLDAAKSTSPHRRAWAITAAALHQKDLGSVLRAAAGAHVSDAPLRACALAALGTLGAIDARELVRDALQAAEPEVRLAAARSAALLGVRDGWQQTLQAQPQLDTQIELQRLLAHGLPAARANAWLLQLSAAPQTMRLAIQFAAALGDLARVPWLIEQCAVPKLARLAAEAIVTLTGVDLEREQLTARKPDDFAAGPSDDPADDDVAVDPDEHALWPNVEALAAWWKQASKRTSGVRCLGGAAITIESLESLLRTARQRLRIAAATELALLQPGQPRFDVEARVFYQRTQLKMPPLYS